MVMAPTTAAVNSGLTRTILDVVVIRDYHVVLLIIVFRLVLKLVISLLEPWHVIFHFQSAVDTLPNPILFSLIHSILI